MPLYEYVCSECRARFERYVRAWGESVACPSCSSDAVEKQLSSFAMGSQAKGAGPSGGTGAACCGGRCGCAH
jgi:putative FmdB family regulatory protein